MADEQTVETGNIRGGRGDGIERRLAWRRPPSQDARAGAGQNENEKKGAKQPLLLADVLLHLVRADFRAVDVALRIDRHAFGRERAAGSG